MELLWVLDQFLVEFSGLHQLLAQTHVLVQLLHRWAFLQVWTILDFAILFRVDLWRGMFSVRRKSFLPTLDPHLSVEPLKIRQFVNFYFLVNVFFAIIKESLDLGPRLVTGVCSGLLSRGDWACTWLSAHIVKNVRELLWLVVRLCWISLGSYFGVLQGWVT